MKTLKKLHLLDAKSLTNRQMKHVIGGSGAGGSGSFLHRFECRCAGEAYEGRPQWWGGVYWDAEQLYKAVNENCVSGGSCDRVSD